MNTPTASSSVGAHRSDAATGLGELRRFGPASQSAVAGLYAWVVTVAPIAWSPHAPRGTWLFAALPPIALLAGIFLEPSKPRAALIVGIWGAIVPSVAVWVRADGTIVGQLDASRAVLGFLGWGAFAFVAAAPPIGHAHIDAKRSEHAPTFVPRVERSRTVNAIALVAAALACGMLQWPRSDGASSEREVFVRVVALAASLLVAARTGDIVASATRKVALGRVASRALPALAWVVGWVVIGVVVNFLLLG